MAVVIVIPARFASSRYPGKPLAPLRGATGEARSLIRRAWDAAIAVPGVDRVLVATDDARVADHAAGFGADVAMTSEECRNGTERCAEVVARGLAGPLDDAAIVVNLQGDAPLTPPWFAQAVIEAMRAAPDLATATPALRCDGASLERFREDRRAGRVGATTVVFRPAAEGAGRVGDALYFSKEIVPFADRVYAPDEPTPVFHHVGLYAYRPAALRRYLEIGPTALEALEGLEQLRFLVAGVPMGVVEVDARGRDFCELNNPIDVERIERALAALGAV